MKSVRDSLNSKSVLLTGATGFLGKVFLERTLRCCPEVAMIYLLVRAKDDTHSSERLETDIFSSQIFDRLKTEHGSSFQAFLHRKVSVVTGDTSRPLLGLKPLVYLELLEKVDLVVNSAASTDFRDRLDDALSNNSLSVSKLVGFVRNSAKARLLHISTCYVSERGEGVVREKIGRPSGDSGKNLVWQSPDKLDLEDTLKKLDNQVRAISKKQKTASKLSESLIRLGEDTARSYGWNNVYTFTKWLGERFLLQAATDMHCIVLRPSIIESVLFEPIPGWIEGLKVADPIFYGFGTGLIRSFPGNTSSTLDMIPFDLVSNAMLLCLAELAAQKKFDLKIYQVCSSHENPLCFKKLTPYLREAFSQTPSTKKVFLPREIFFAIFGSISGLQKFFLKSLRPLLRSRDFFRRLDKMSRKMDQFLVLAKLYAPYTSIRCRYDNSELLGLHSRAHPQDQLSYPVSTRAIQWDQYLSAVHIPGLLKYVIKKNEKPQIKAKYEAVRRQVG